MPKKNKKIKIKSPVLLFVSIVLSQLAGIIGSFATAGSVSTWYVILNKPSFNPPNWLFGPVWISLYTLMGVSLYLVWIQLQKPSSIIGWFKYQFNRKKIHKMQSAVIFFFIHLVVNALWSLVFFGLKDLGAAFVIIVLLWTMIVVLIKEFFQFDKRAAMLLLPYLAWVTFASALNYSIWILN